jgi:hypothetical protein
MDTNQTPNADAQADATKKVEEALAGKKDGEVQAKPEEATLKFINETLKRDFKSLPEAQKSLENLNAFVGDNSIAALREQAKEGELFTKVVQAVASSQGVSLQQARKDLLEEIQGVSSETKSPVGSQASAQSGTPDPVAEEVNRLKLKIETKELLDLHPEAKLVLNELNILAKASGKSLVETFESSGLKEAAKKAVDFDKSKEAPSASVNPSSRQGEELTKSAELVEKVKKQGRFEDKADLVAKYFGY